MINCFTIERYTEIERENRILLEKMTNIMQNRTTAYSAGAGTIHPNPHINYLLGSLIPSSVINPQTNTFNSKRSLNKDVRKRELLKITMEN